MDVVPSCSGLCGAVARLLDDFSIEITPGEEADFNPSPETFPAGREVFITHLPGRPIASTVTAARRLADGGYRPVPHMAARNFESDRHFSDLAEQIAQLGIGSALLIGGGVKVPRGPFHEALDLLEHGSLQANGFDKIYYAGHPEGHPHVTANLIESRLRQKIYLARSQGLQPAIITQFGFDGLRYADWAAYLRSTAVDAPIVFGVAGVTSFSKLLKFAANCGVGASITALRAKKFALTRLLGPITPSDVIKPLADRIFEFGIPCVRIHFFNFGAYERTLEWAAVAGRSDTSPLPLPQHVGAPS